MRLEGEVALVTGAGRGIGRACVEALAEQGARVIAVARSEGDLQELARHESGRVETWAMDVTDAALLEKISALQHISILVNNAGTNKPQPFLEVQPDTLDSLINLNLKAVFRVSQAVAGVMVARGIAGSIINMSSQMGHVGSPGRTVYCMTKHGLEGLTKTLAIELAPHGIRVNSVAPTFVETPMTKPMLDDPEFHRFVLDRIPLGRLATVEEVAAAVVYLAAPESRSTTGTSLLIDGGWTAQ